MMSKALPKRFEMRLSEIQNYRLTFIKDQIGADSKADVLRCLITKGYDRLRRDE